MSVLGSASGLKTSDFSESVLPTKASIVFVMPGVASPLGTGGRTTGWNAQWSAPLADLPWPFGSIDSGSVARSSGQWAPAAIHSFTSFCSSAVSGSPSAGISDSLSDVVIRTRSSLSSGLPATMPAAPESPPSNAFSRRSIRKPLSASCGPWHDPHLVASSGATRLAKSMASPIAVRAAPPVRVAVAHMTNRAVHPVRWSIE